MAKPILTLEEKFTQRVEPEPNTGCWIWTGLVNNKGYGWLGIAVNGKSRNRLAHRIAWELFRGPIPDGLFCLHRCDQPLCSNPDHLFLGTHRDNMADCAMKRRHPVASSGLPFGVRYAHDIRRKKPFHAQVRFGMKMHHLGYFATADEASAVAIAFKDKCYRGEV